VEEIERRPPREPPPEALPRRPPRERVRGEERRRPERLRLLLELELGLLAGVAELALEPLVDALGVLVDEVARELGDLALHLLRLGVAPGHVADPVLVDEADHPRRVEARVAEPAAPEVEAAAQAVGADVRGGRD